MWKELQCCCRGTETLSWWHKFMKSWDCHSQWASPGQRIATGNNKKNHKIIHKKQMIIFNRTSDNHDKNKIILNIKCWNILAYRKLHQNHLYFKVVQICHVKTKQTPRNAFMQFLKITVSERLILCFIWICIKSAKHITN